MDLAEFIIEAQSGTLSPEGQAWLDRMVAAFNDFVVAYQGLPESFHEMVRAAAKDAE